MISEEVGPELLGTRPPWEPGTWRPSSCTLSVSLSSVSFLRLTVVEKLFCSPLFFFAAIYRRDLTAPPPHPPLPPGRSMNWWFTAVFFSRRKVRNTSTKYQVQFPTGLNGQWSILLMNEVLYVCVGFKKKKIKSCIFFNFTNSFIFEIFYISVTSIFWSEYFHMVHTRYKSFDTKIIYFCTCEKILMTSHWH